MARWDCAAAKKAKFQPRMSQRKLSKALALTQKERSVAFGVQRPAIAKVERKTNTHSFNLRTYIEAMGETLRIVTEFEEVECHHHELRRSCC